MLRRFLSHEPPSWFLTIFSMKILIGQIMAKGPGKKDVVEIMAEKTQGFPKR